MKTRLTGWSLAAVGLLACAVSASPVSESDVRYAAQAWRAGTDALGADLGAGVVSLSALTTTNAATFYAVKLSGKGTVFMNSDDALEPVIGFTSSTNDFSTIDPKSPLWALLNRDVSSEQAMLRTRVKQSGTATAATATTSAKAAKWQALIAAGKLNRASSVSAASGISDLRVPALVQTKWSQGTARGQYCYNYYTPNHAVCGCVATAMSQIMRYHQYPTASIAAFSETCSAGKNDESVTNCVLTAQGGVYDWANMPLVPASATYNEAQWQMIGKITSDAGIAVNMGYTDDDGSGAYGAEAGASMKTHFGYSNAVYGEIGSRMASDSSTRADDLQRTFFSNFDAGLPVFVAVPGHAVVADGYGYIGETDYVHFNMGWAGQCDYWYNIPDLTEADDSFTAINSVNYNIFTTNATGSAVMSGRVLDASGSPCSNVTVTVSTSSGTVAATTTTSSTGVWGVILPAGTYSVQAASTSASSTLTSTAKSVKLSAPTTVSGSYVNRTVTWASTKDWGNSWGNDVVVESDDPDPDPDPDPDSGADAVYARLVNGAFVYLDESKVETTAPAGGMNKNITVLFSTEADYANLCAVTQEVAKAAGLELESNLTLSNNVDWTTLDFNLGSNTLSLANYKLDIANMPGIGTITYSSVNILKNGNFEADTVTDGTGVAMCPTDWTKGGTVYVWKNWHDNGDTQCNGSTWIHCKSGGYVSQSFVAPHDGTYTFSFNHAPWNSTTGCAWSGAYAQVDGTSIFTTSVLWWGTASFSKDYQLSAGTHTLKIGCSSGWGFNFDNISVVGTGVLNVNVPEGGSVTNSETTVTGGSKVQVWKTGKGALLMSKVNTGFGASGSTSLVVKEGTVNKASSATCGAQYSRIVVEDGGQIDIAARGYHDYDYTLAGAGPDGLGALVNRTANSNPHWTNGAGFMRNISLAGDAAIGGTTPFSMAFWNSNPNTTTLNGHTLTLGGTTIYSGTMSFAGAGTVYVAEGATYKFNDFWNGTVTIKQGTLKVGGTLEIQGNMISEASNLVFTATGKFAASAAKSTIVYDTYAPNLAWTSSQKHPTITLGTTSSLYTTLDLSLFTDTFDGSTTTFYANSYVTVALGSRALTPGQKLVSWSTKPNVIAFVGTGDNLGAMRLLAKDDGLYVIAEPAYAEWDVTNNCWNYFTQDGAAYPTEWTDGITSNIDVHFSSFAEFEAIKAQGVSPAKYVLTKLELTPGHNLYDFTTGFDFVLMPNMVIDLQGNRLKLPSAHIGGAVPFTITDTSDFMANGSFEEYNGSIGNSGNWNYLTGGVSFKNWTGATSAGITKNSGTWINSAVPAGTYACYMQNNSYIQQTITSPGDSNYRLSFSYAARPSYTGATLAVYVDDTAVATITGISSTAFTARTVDFALTAGTHTLKFATTLVNGTDQGTAIDNVKLGKIGELIVDVASGVSIANSQVAIIGNVQVAKTGAGTLTASRASQSYIGGTEVAAGQLTLGNNTCLGASGDTITVDAGATLEINGVIDLYNYAFVLNGGTLQNTKSDIGDGKAQISNVRLTADSTFKPSCTYGIVNSSYNAATLDLAGHTLTVPVGAGKTFYLFNTTVTAGTIDLTSGGWLRADKTALNAPNTTFRVNCGLNVAVPFTVGGYEALYSGTNNTGTGVMTVKQTFKPTNAYYRGVTLTDGATIDLTAYTGVMPSVSSFTAGPNALTYPTNATLQVELHGRKLTSPKVIAWDAAPADLKFEPTEQTHRDGRRFESRDDGLYVISGMVLYFR